MAGVKLEGVWKTYGSGVAAVQDATFEVEDGEFVVLVGPSGCGKSTTLRMIAGLESISEGTLYIGGAPVNGVAPKDRDVAMVFQNYALYPHMSVYDNMAFGLKLRRYDKAEIERRVRRAAEVLGVEDVLNRKPRHLSGGQRQRVALGRAIVRKPKVFLFDEPLSNLDAKLRVQMRTEISKLHRRLQATMIYVTHDQVEAMTMGDRIIVLQDGVIQQIDTPMNLYSKPVNQFVAGFIGSPAMNFVEGEIDRGAPLCFRAAGGFALPLSRAQQDQMAAYAGRRVVLGIRPEDIHAGRPADRPGRVAEADLVLDVIEPLGSEVFIYARLQDQLVVGRVAPQVLPAPGETIRLAFDLTKLHFFDPETGQAIRSEV